uniref:Peptidase S1 domain-containing protein n=1 Tax=Clastoptera arizonana TaxID=38151 RepID=A0A1B6E6Y0_9HEMI
MLSCKIVLLVVNLFAVALSLQYVTQERSLKNLFKNKLGIVNGKNTTIESHPYQCSVIYYGSFFCSCVILNQNWVLTLADCIYNSSPEYYQIQVGSNSSSFGGSLYFVDEFEIHPDYNVESRDYSLGLIKLNGYLTFSNSVQKINMATKDLKKGKKVVISGWGESKFGNTFQDLTLKTVSHDDCEYVYEEYGYEVTDSMICAKANNAGPCFNDFGDPLVNRNKLYALFSWCFNCGDNNFPGVFISVPECLDWIKETIND